MHKIITRTAGVAVALAVSGGMLALTAPSASAQSIKAHGTVTRAESNKVHHAVDKQWCLGLTEARRLVGAQGKIDKRFATGKKWPVYEFTGAHGSSVQHMTLWFHNGCVYSVDTNLTHGRWQTTWNQARLSGQTRGHD